jgi:hypothetical protein
MNDTDFELAKLDEKEREFYNKIKGLTDMAYKKGYMDGVKSIISDDGDDEVEGTNVRRFRVTRSGLLAFVIIVFGSIFSLGMYIGGLNG